MDGLPQAFGQMPQNMPQEMQNQGQEQEPDQIFAYVSKDEIPGLNEMQGQEVIDPETGLRDYTLLGYMAENIPEVRNALMEAGDMIKTIKS
jgi:hypothetical protein